MRADDITAIVERHGDRLGGLISVLEEIQAKYGYLPEDALRIVAERRGRSLVDVYGVATFYKFFRLSPRGEHLVVACLGTACHVRGGARVVEQFERQLGIRAGETTPDNQFTLETVNCLGACALGPVVVIDGHYFSKVKESRVAQLVDNALKGLDRTEIGEDKRIFPIEVSCPRCNHTLMDDSILVDGYPSVRLAISFQGKCGWLRLSSLYGSHSMLAEYEVPIDAVTAFFCPHCQAQLGDSWQCPTCGAPMVPMVVRGGGAVRICSRRGCKDHMLDLMAGPRGESA
jgi:NADH-quinone oxidoreductase subunit E